MPHLTSPKVILYFVFLSMLDHAVFPAFGIGGVYPSFLYLFVCYASFEWETKKTIPVAFWAGLLKDFIGGGLLGVQAGILVAMALLLDQAVRRIEREFPGIYFFIALLYVVFCELFKLAFGMFIGRVDGFLSEHIGTIILMGVYTALLLPVFSSLTRFATGDRALSRQYELFK